MGQELVKFNGATGIVERPEYSLAPSGLTPNQERLRGLINGEILPEEARVYNPPNLETDAANANIAVAGQLTRIESFDPATDMARSRDPKACWTGFAFGIACAAVIGGAFFLSIAAVVTPQPSVAALVPIEVEGGNGKFDESKPVALGSAGITAASGAGRPGTVPPETSASKIWQELRRFHASAGKFSQPRIPLISRQTPPNFIDGDQLNGRKAALSKPSLVSVAKADPAKASGSTASERERQLMPHIINAVGKPSVLERKATSATVKQSTDLPSKTAQQSTPREVHIWANHTNGLKISEDTMAGATRAVIEGARESGPSETIEGSPIPTAGKRVKIIKSSLRPTARTKVRLPEGRKRSIVGSKGSKSGLRVDKLAKKKRVAQQNTFFKIQTRPDWAKSAFSQNN